MAERKQHPSDRPQMVISITSRGLHVMDWSQQRLSRAVADAEKEVGPGAADLLRALADALTAQLPSSSHAAR